MRARLIYGVLVLLFVLAWASGFTAAKIALSTCPPALFGGVRFLLTGAVLLGYAAWRGDLRKPVPWASLTLLGLLNQAGYQGLAWQGMGTVSAGLATIIASLNPILIAALAAPLLGERLHWRKVLGLLLGFAGAVFVVRNRIVVGHEDRAGRPAGRGRPALAGGGHGGVQMARPGGHAARRRRRADAWPPGRCCCAWAATFENPSLAVIGPRFWLVMAWCVLVMSIGALLLWFWLLRHGTASSASALHFLIPPIGLAMAWLVLGESISPLDLLGIVPVALGIWLATRPAPARRAAVA